MQAKTEAVWKKKEAVECRRKKFMQHKQGFKFMSNFIIISKEKHE